MARKLSTTAIFILGGLVVAVALGLFVSPFASSSPDGLEKVAEDKEFLETAKDSAVADSPLADYAVSGVDNEKVSIGLSGLIGVLLTFGVGMLVFGSLRLLRGGGRQPAAG